MLKKIDHIAIVVKDLDKAAKSYADMFGFKVVEKREGPAGEFTFGDDGLGGYPSGAVPAFKNGQ